MAQAFAFKKSPEKQSGVRFIFLCWSLFLFLALGAFFVENIALISEHPHSFMNDTQFFCSLATVLVMAVGYLIVVHRNFHIGIHWGWLLFFLILFCCDVIGVFALKAESGLGVYAKDQSIFAWSYDPTLMERIRYVITFGVSCMFFYMWFAIFPKVFHNVRRMHFFYWIFLCVVTASIAYSVLRERALYVDFFAKGSFAGEFVSFTNNPNVFAWIITVGVCCCGFLNNRRTHWYYWLLMLALGAYQFIICSGTGILVSWAYISAYAVYRFCVRVRYYPWRSVLALLLYIGGFVTLIVLLTTKCLGPNNFLTKVSEALSKASFHNGAFDTRVEIRNQIIGLMNTPIRWVFGVGDTQSLYYLGAMSQPKEAGLIFFAHSGFFHQLLSGGLVRVLAYVVILVRILYLVVILNAKKSKIAWPCLIFMGAMILHGCLENTSFLAMDTKGATLYLLVVLPLEVEKHVKIDHAEEVGAYNEALKEEADKRYYQYEYTPLQLARITFTHITPLVILGLGMGPLFFNMGLFRGYDRWIYYAMWIEGFFCLPLGAYCIGLHPDKVDRKVYGWLYMGGLITFFALAMPLFRDYPIIGYIAVGVIPGLTLLAVLFHWKSFWQFRQRLLLRAYLPFTLIAGSLIGLCLLGYLIPKNQQSLFNPIFIGAAAMLAYASIMLTKPGERLAYPEPIWWLHGDNRHSARGLLKEERLEAKQDRFLEGNKPDPVPPKPHYIRFD